MFCLLHKHTNDDDFDDSPKISVHFPKISEDFPKLFREPDERFRTFPNIFKDCQRLPKTTEEDPKMSGSYINKYLSVVKRTKEKCYQKRNDIFTV